MMEPTTAANAARMARQLADRLDKLPDDATLLYEVAIQVSEGFEGDVSFDDLIAASAPVVLHEADKGPSGRSHSFGISDTLHLRIAGFAPERPSEEVRARRLELAKGTHAGRRASTIGRR